jgi:hypothetical protein
MTYIYILENEGIPFYIGKTVNVNQRKNHHKRFKNINLQLIIIDEVSDDDWKFWEEYWISQFKTWGFKLDNKNKGGGGPTFWTEEQKLFINPERINKIKNNKNRGNKISNTLLKNNHSKYYTNEVRKKISNSNKGKPRPFTKEHQQAILISKRKQAKPLLMFDLNDNFIKEWESKGQAAEWLKQQTGKTSNITTQIKDCVLGKQKTALGYKWKYK